MWISVNSISKQAQLRNTSERRIEFYPADRYFQIDEKNSIQKSYLLDVNILVKACRLLIHISTTKLQNIPTFTVNATAYRPPDKQSGEWTVPAIGLMQIISTSRLEY